MECQQCKDKISISKLIDFFVSETKTDRITVLFKLLIVYNFNKSGNFMRKLFQLSIK